MKFRSVYRDDLIFKKDKDCYTYLGRLRKYIDKSKIRKILCGFGLSNPNNLVYIFNKDNLGLC